MLNVAILAVQALFPSHGRAAEPVGAVFPPWWSSERVFQAAGSTGDILRTGAFGTVVIVRSAEPNLAERLRSVGALITLSALHLSGCTSEPQEH